MIAAAASSLRAGRVSSLDLTNRCLDRIEKFEPRLNAFVTVLADEARTRAAFLDAELRRGRDRGPLHGIPIALKDLFETRGIRTTAGSKLFEDWKPDRDAAVVEKLDEAGAVLLGKTGMHELAYGITSNNAWFGAVRNPWDPERIPGGSSGGSGAAVAAEMCYLAMGSDTGGSIRIPASFCGTVGLKPTLGRVSKRGALPLGFTLDHMGPLTRTVRDAAVVLQAIAGHDPGDPSSSREPVADYLPPEDASVRGLRIGLPENFFFDRIAPQVDAAVKALARAAEAEGAEVIPVRVPDFEEINTVARMILLPEAAAAHQEALRTRREAISPEVRALLDQGRLLPATDYVQAQRLRTLMCDDFAQIWRRVDLLLTPAAPTPAPKIGQTTLRIGGEEMDVRLATTRLVRGFNLLGVPVLSLPCGFAEPEGMPLPLGAQLVAPPFAEALLLRAGVVLEQLSGAGRRTPELLL